MKYITKVLIALISLSIFTHTIYADENTKNVEVVYNEPAIVTFICDNASTSIKVYQGELINEPPHYLIDGYIFAGWYDGEYKWDFKNDVVMDNLTLVAKYNHISGSIVNITNPETNGLHGWLDIDAESIPLSDKDIIDLEDGLRMNIELKVNLISNDEIDSEYKNILDNTTSDIKHNTIQYFSTDLIKTINGREDYILQTNNEYTVELQIPEDQRATNREYAIIEYRDGQCNVLYSGRPQDNWKLSFNTNITSTYVLTYKVVNNHKPVDEYDIPNTGVDGGIVIASGTNKIDNIQFIEIVVSINTLLILIVLYLIYRQSVNLNLHINDENIHKKRRKHEKKIN